MEVFQIHDLTYYYPRKEDPALKDINVSIKEGEFILLIGSSGSGKSTLGRVFNKIVPQFYGGKIKGKVEGNTDVGMVFQDPEKQLVMDKVERELAFGLENIGTDYKTMRKKVMEALSFLNIYDIKDKKTYELSGGQKQKVAIGSVISMGYKFLVLDEPTSQLDPISSEEILNILKRLNEELGYTIVLIEQRIDRCFHLADRILFMENGSLVFDGEPEEFVFWSNKKDKNFLPSVCDYFVKKGYKNIPFTVKEGRKKLRKLFKDNISKKEVKFSETKKEEVIIAKDINFIYENGKHALKGINLSVYKGEVLGILGENGGGKSTLLKNISGLLKPTKGKLSVKGVVGYLSQNPNDYLFNDSVYEELKYTLDNKGIKDYGIIEKSLKTLDIYKYKDKNPRDLSGGERQRVAIASILVMEPDILILDEPTRGLDKDLKEKLGDIILDLKNRGKTIILVTHDVEFTSKFCDRACLIFDGSIAQVGSKYDVLTSGIYYSTQINKLFSGYVDNILTLDDALNITGDSLIKGAI
ncbi:ABC transporter ATP-binding protein [Tepidibacter formicigenes]|uniref:Energy-coupling factor transport system ATP-binding protein n=1 Tax=Tepidibacter formicigenes DSM 15518 TaxID=1123349 RepID=A0A1M6QQS6_9FIRM|nr:ATP-binding cassette domain-containing protein [Tepidibacter formicigenes]SHK22639.1 energy-coupling factor transport system ATP-binding protein [Tepidibacter formicigenes DSM 15518]